MVKRVVKGRLSLFVIFPIVAAAMKKTIIMVEWHTVKEIEIIINNNVEGTILLLVADNDSNNVIILRRGNKLMMDEGENKK